MKLIIERECNSTKTVERTCIPLFKFEQKCQLNEAERGQKLLSTKLSCPAFLPRAMGKPCMCPVVPSSCTSGLPAAWTAREQLAALTIMLGAALHASDMRLLSKLEPSAKWAPVPRPVQPADNLQLVCNCCTNMHFLSLMILAPSQGSTQKGPEQWDVIVLKCAQQEALLQHISGPRL